MKRKLPANNDTEGRPDVSVVLPVFNGEHCIHRALASMIEQALPRTEILVIDDGSSDATVRAVEDCAAGRRGVRLIKTEHLGIVHALNVGIRESRGEYIARMDADDIAFPSRLVRQKEYLDLHPETGLVSCLVDFGGDRVLARGYAQYVDWLNGIRSFADIRRNRFVESPIPHPSVMFRRSLTERFGAYREGDFPEDYELWLRWLEAGVRMVKIPQILLEWSDPPGRLSRSNSRYSPEAFYRCKAEYLARWLKRHNPRHPCVAVWGAGRTTRKRAEMLVEHGVAIDSYIDIDPRKIGQTIHGRPVLAPSDIPGAGVLFIVSYVGSRGARRDIRQRLGDRGWIEEIHFVVAA